jgi:hypothetical protein
MDRDFRKNIDGAVVTNIRVRLITLTKLGGPAASLLSQGSMEGLREYWNFKRKKKAVHSFSRLF